jgi:ABC-type polar amino acid transport system ATPase subunit
MRAPTESAKIVTIEKLSLRYGSRQVLRGIDLHVGAGEVVVLLGASGSGKTSLLRCINLLSMPQSGRICIGGEPIFDTSPEGHDKLALSQAQIGRIRARTGMVFQQFNLFPHMSVLRNVMEAPMIVGGLPRERAEAEARALLAQLGLEAHADKRPAQLSGGQQQRVGIARALAMKPAVMLFDEPTSALDPELVGEVLRAMVALARSGMTMVIVTHELGLAFEIADRVVFLDGGDIIASGPPADVLLAPKHPRVAGFVARFHESIDMLKPFLETV